MIYVGYQGVGKSSISGKNNCIDLESGNFWLNNTRSEEWYKIYCNIAKHLDNQGYNVFLSSHKAVREELNNRNIDFIVIYSSLQLKDKWILRLKKRYKKTNLEKDYKALKNAELMYEENIKNLMNEKNIIEIKDIEYNLINLIK